MQQIVECVPNFSDGRRPEVYNAIADAIRSVDNIRFLDLSADPDHNRTVITFVGSPDDVSEAAFRAIQKAAELINLDEHNGEHPRIGATDVCPFIPVQGITLLECASLATRLGQRVGEELNIPVYLYERAATRPEREKLSDIRKGEYELWKKEIGVKESRQPDFGPAEPQKSGPTVIGARPFLIAYNLYLNTDDVEIADNIAKNVRYTSGGFRYVQAKGFLVEGQGQVSMNLTNYNRSALHQVQEAVRREAAAYGLTITHAELVGMIPQQALINSAKWYLQLHDLDDNQILEYKMQAIAAQDNLLPKQFLEATASGTPTPGGGSVAALAGALATALGQMVAGLTTRRRRYKDVAEEVHDLLVQLGDLRRQLTDAIADDAAAFEAVMAASKDKSLEGDAKKQAVETATKQAAAIPLTVARLSHQAAEYALRLATIGNPNAVTDAAAAVIMARSAVEIAGLNVKINLTTLEDRELALEWGAEIDKLKETITILAAQAAQVAAERGGF
ncbi:MAG TPA: glutamate formimidoyltransferase [Anaerolineae bacterium]|nr:glutamate formimidoyltransferase [Anaerolineae bacterium]